MWSEEDEEDDEEREEEDEDEEQAAEAAEAEAAPKKKAQAVPAQGIIFLQHARVSCGLMSRRWC